jgi:hypothetical protein
MDYWQSIALRASQPDIVRQWATLEGKSMSMSDDLFRGFLVQRSEFGSILPALGFVAELFGLLSEAWQLLGRP